MRVHIKTTQLGDAAEINNYYAGIPRAPGCESLLSFNAYFTEELVSSQLLPCVFKS